MMRVAVVMVAILAGLGAGWLALQATWREPPQPETIVVKEPKVDVLTTTVDLSRGAKLSDAHLAWISWPADRVRPGMILATEQPGAVNTLTGRVLRSNLYSGEPIRSQHLSQKAGGFLSMALQPGMRGLGVPISEDKTAGGFVLPNDRVDVLHTVVRDIDGDGSATGTTRTILTNVRVLAIGRTTFDEGTLVDTGAPEASAGSGNGSTLTGNTATLEVTAEQGEILMAAAASGQLALALRAAEDFGLSGIGDLAMLEGAAPEPPPATAQHDGGNAEPGRRQREVTIISAGVTQTVITAVARGSDG